MISGEGLAPTASWNGLAPLVFASVVSPGPAPRKVMPFGISRKLPSLMMKVPAPSCTTWPMGQALIAAWIWAVSSRASPRGESVAQTAERIGIPPTPIIPGLQVVARSAGRKLAGGELAAVVHPNPQVARPAMTTVAWMRARER